MSRIHIDYMPEISENGAEYIENNFSASMEAVDGSTKQYDLPILIADIGGELPTEDLAILNKLLEDGVDYIEI
tara:strand:+ start:551 stop:769 length:219 start_codon:yes stop_codon:yes gene_type:complete